jgi:hypothetical protein
LCSFTRFGEGWKRNRRHKSRDCHHWRHQHHGWILAAITDG